MSIYEAAQQALEALEIAMRTPINEYLPREPLDAIHALRAALAEEAPPRSMDEDKQKLLITLDNLRRAAYWVVQGGEFWEWVKNKSMPYAAAKELDELAEMITAADQAIYGMSITLDGKRIDPASIYKQEVPQDHIADASNMVATSQDSRQVEPVAHITGYYHGYTVINSVDHRVLLPVGMALYRSPPKREPLTDEEIESCIDEGFEYGLDRGNISNKPVIRFARAIERAHGIGGEE